MHTAQFDNIGFGGRSRLHLILLYLAQGGLLSCARLLHVTPRYSMLELQVWRRPGVHLIRSRISRAARCSAWLVVSLWGLALFGLPSRVRHGFAMSWQTGRRARAACIGSQQAGRPRSVAPPSAPHAARAANRVVPAPVPRCAVWSAHAWPGRVRRMRHARTLDVGSCGSA